MQKLQKKVCGYSELNARRERQKEFQKNSSDEDEIKEAELELENAEESQKEILKFELEGKKNQMRRRSLGNVRFIGELYKVGMLTPKIMMECVGMLLCMDEEKLECLCVLLTTVGPKLEEGIRDLEVTIAQKKKGWFDKTFDKLKKLSRNETLSLRIRSALEDVHELRLNNWKPLVRSNKSSGFQQQQTQGKRGFQANPGQSSPVLGPPVTQWGPQPPFEKVSQPPTNVPPRYQPRSFGLLDNEEKRTPAPTPSREDIVKPLPTTYKRNAQRSTANIPSLFANRTPPKGWAKNQIPPTSPLNANERHSPPSPAGRSEMDPNQIVKNISNEFFFSKNFDDTIDWIQEKFPRDQIGVFIEMFSRKIAQNSKADQQKLAGILVKNLVSRRLVSKEKVMNSIMKGVISDLPDIKIDTPMAVSYLAVFLAEIFSEENKEQWLKYLRKHQSILTKLMVKCEQLGKVLP